MFVGLFVGKTLGIFSFSYLFACTPFASMPTGMSKRNLFGVSMLGGIGFTVALFIANLSFDGSTAAGADLLNRFKRSAPAAVLPSKERFAINKATVKPIPPNMDTPNKLRLLMPVGMEANGVHANK